MSTLKLGEPITPKLMELHNKAAGLLAAKLMVMDDPETPEQDSVVLVALSKRYAEVCVEINKIHTEQSFQIFEPEQMDLFKPEVVFDSCLPQCTLDPNTCKVDFCDFPRCSS